jgi:hypothetical protein
MNSVAIFAALLTLFDETGNIQTLLDFKRKAYSRLDYLNKQRERETYRHHSHPQAPIPQRIF